MASWQTVDGERLRELRLERMYSQVELAKMAGLTQARVSNLEQEKHRAQPRTVRRLAEALGVEPKELVKKQA